jgi:hypothetical protein
MSSQKYEFFKTDRHSDNREVLAKQTDELTSYALGTSN